MKEVKLVFFENCPNYPVAKELLQDSKVDFEEIDQGKLSSDDPLNGYSSPTVLFKSKIVFGSKLIGGGCTLQIPTALELNKKLLAMKESL